MALNDMAELYPDLVILQEGKIAMHFLIFMLVSIIITAPLGTILIEYGGKKWLTKKQEILKKKKT